MKTQQLTIINIVSAKGLSLLFSKVIKTSCDCALALLICLAFPKVADAQFAEPLIPAPSESLADKAGFSQSSATSPMPAPVESDVNDSSTFASITNPARTTVYVYTRGKRDSHLHFPRCMVLTIRPSLLTTEQASDINGILGINILSGQRTIEADASVEQLALIQAILARSPNDSTLGLAVINRQGDKQINHDPSAAQWAALRRPTDQPLYTYNGPVPGARILARMFVILALVAATIYVAFAAFSITTGQAHGGSRVIAAAAGLMLLLMSYTIYKIMIMNVAYRSGSSKAITASEPFPDHQGLVKEKSAPVADTPAVPSPSTSYAPRTNMPVQPLSGGR